MTELRGRDRLIVALDVASRDEAMQLVDGLRGTVSFFKVGSEMLGVWGPDFVDQLTQDGCVFVDLKLGDISETARRTVAVWAEKPGVKFLTIGNATHPKGIEAAKQGKGGRSDLELLYVSFLSSLDAADFESMSGHPESNFDQHVRNNCERALNAGCDGLIASGRHIEMLSKAFPGITIVSPGIRPAGSPIDDHMRSATPTEAIKMGAKYLVVGRPIRNSSDPSKAAQGIIDEIDQALGSKPNQPARGSGPRYDRQAMNAKPPQH